MEDMASQSNILNDIEIIRACVTDLVVSVSVVQLTTRDIAETSEVYTSAEEANAICNNDKTMITVENGEPEICRMHLEGTRSAQNGDLQILKEVSDVINYCLNRVCVDLKKHDCNDEEHPTTDGYAKNKSGNADEVRKASIDPQHQGEIKICDKCTFGDEETSTYSDIQNRSELKAENCEMKDDKLKICTNVLYEIVDAAFNICYHHSTDQIVMNTGRPVILDRNPACVGSGEGAVNSNIVSLEHMPDSCPCSMETFVARAVIVANQTMDKLGAVNTGKETHDVPKKNDTKHANDTIIPDTSRCNGKEDLEHCDLQHDLYESQHQCNVLEEPEELNEITEQREEQIEVSNQLGEQNGVLEKAKEQNIQLAQPVEHIIVSKQPGEQNVVTEQLEEPMVGIEQPKNQNVVSEQLEEQKNVPELTEEQNILLEQPEKPNVPSEQPREQNVLSKQPEEQNVVPQHQGEQNVSEQPEEQNVSEQPEEQNVSEQPEEQNVSEQPEEQNVSEQPEEQNVSEQPEEQNVSEQPEEQNVSEQPEEQNVSDEPEEQKFVIEQPKNQNVISEQLEGQKNVSEQPEKQNISEEPEVQNVVLEQPKEEKVVSEQPEEQNGSEKLEQNVVSLSEQLGEQNEVLKQPEGQNGVLEQPEEQNVSKQPEEQNVISEKPEEQKVVIEQPKEQNEVLEQPKEQNKVLKQPKEQKVVSDQPGEQNILSQQPEEQNVVSEQIEQQNVLPEQQGEQHVVSEQLEEHNVVSEQPEEQNVVTEQLEEQENVPEQTEEQNILSEQPEEQNVSEKPEEQNVSDQHDEQNVSEQIEQQNVLPEQQGEQHVVSQQPKEQNVVSEQLKEQENVPEQSEEQNILSEQPEEQNEVFEQPKEQNILSEQPEEQNVSEKPEEQNVSDQHDEQNVSEKPGVQNVLSEQPKEQNIESEQPEEQNVVLKLSKEQNVSDPLEEPKVSDQSGEQNILSELPEEQNVLKQPQEQNVLSELPEEQNVLKQPQEQNVSEKPEEQNVSEEPKEQNQVLEQPEEQNHVLERPEEQNQVMEQPEEQNHVLERPKKQNQVLEQPEEHNQVLEQPEEQNHVLEQPEKQNQVLEQPEEQNQVLEQREEQNQVLEQPEEQNQVLEQPEEQNQVLEQPEEQNQVLEQPEEQNQVLEQPEEQNDVSHLQGEQYNVLIQSNEKNRVLLLNKLGELYVVSEPQGVQCRVTKEPEDTYEESEEQALLTDSLEQYLDDSDVMPCAQTIQSCSPTNEEEPCEDMSFLFESPPQRIHFSLKTVCGDEHDPKVTPLRSKVKTVHFASPLVECQEYVVSDDSDSTVELNSQEVIHIQNDVAVKCNSNNRQATAVKPCRLFRAQSFVDSTRKMLNKLEDEKDQMPKDPVDDQADSQQKIAVDITIDMEDSQEEKGTKYIQEDNGLRHHGSLIYIKEDKETREIQEEIVKRDIKEDKVDLGIEDFQKDKGIGNIQEDTERTNVEEDQGMRDIQEDKGVGDIQEDKEIVDIQEDKGMGDVQEDKVMRDIHENKGIGDIQEDKVMGDVQEDKGMRDIQEDKGMGDIQEDKGMGDIQKDKGIGDIQENKGMGDIQEDKVMGDFQEDKGMRDIQEDKGMGDSQEDKGIGDIQEDKDVRDKEDKGIRDVQEEKEIKDSQGKQDVIDIQEDKGIVDHQEDKGMGDIQENKGMGDIKEDNGVRDPQEDKELEDSQGRQEVRDIQEDKSDEMASKCSTKESSFSQENEAEAFECESINASADQVDDIDDTQQSSYPQSTIEMGSPDSLTESQVQFQRQIQQPRCTLTAQDVAEMKLEEINTTPLQTAIHEVPCECVIMSSQSQETTQRKIEETSGYLQCLALPANYYPDVEKLSQIEEEEWQQEIIEKVNVGVSQEDFIEFVSALQLMSSQDSQASEVFPVVKHEVRKPAQCVELHSCTETLKESVMKGCEPERDSTEHKASSIQQELCIETTNELIYNTECHDEQCGKMVCLQTEEGPASSPNITSNQCPTSQRDVRETERETSRNIATADDPTVCDVTIEAKSDATNFPDEIDHREETSDAFTEPIFVEEEKIGVPEATVNGVCGDKEKCDESEQNIDHADITKPKCKITDQKDDIDTPEQSNQTKPDEDTRILNDKPAGEVSEENSIILEKNTAGNNPQDTVSNKQCAFDIPEKKVECHIHEEKVSVSVTKVEVKTSEETIKNCSIKEKGSIANDSATAETYVLGEKYRIEGDKSNLASEMHSEQKQNSWELDDILDDNSDDGFGFLTTQPFTVSTFMGAQSTLDLRMITSQPFQQTDVTQLVHMQKDSKDSDTAANSRATKRKIEQCTEYDDSSKIPKRKLDKVCSRETLKRKHVDEEVEAAAYHDQQVPGMITPKKLCRIEEDDELVRTEGRLPSPNFKWRFVPTVEDDDLAMPPQDDEAEAESGLYFPSLVQTPRKARRVGLSRRHHGPTLHPNVRNVHCKTTPLQDSTILET